MKMKINIISKKLIKPITPTAQHLNQYSISFTDECCPPVNVRILFYTSASNRIHQLEESLAQILPRFYPLAGRYVRSDHAVYCSDEGAEFIQAEAADLESMDLVRSMESHHLNHLLPRHFFQIDESAAASPLLSVQATRFKCGGLALGVAVAHRIFDAASLETFVLAWSNSGGIAIDPSFDSPSLLPRGDLDCTALSMDTSEMRKQSICAKRFLFTSEAITRLRSELRREVSRVRVVCAVVAKALIGVERARHGWWRPCLVFQAFNVRERTVPPLPRHACGNLAIQSVTRSISSENASVGESVDVLDEAIEKTTSDCSRILGVGADGLKEIVVEVAVNAMVKSSTGEANVMWFSDWSKFGFGGRDLGWGKPVWASIGPVVGDNTVDLTESGEEGGIEAWVHLKYSNEMAWFEKDEGIRLFAQ